MKRPSLIGPLPRLALNSRTIVSVIAAEILVLSVLHHWLNFWGLPWDRQALAVFVVGPALGVVLSLLLAPISGDLTSIPRRNWLLFLASAIPIGMILVLHFASSPEVRHQLIITPRIAGSSQEVTLLEIRSADGSDVPLSSFATTPGWHLRENTLITSDPAAEPLVYAFVAPVGRQVRVTCLASPGGGQVQVLLDAARVDLDLAGSSSSQPRARLDTLYHWGPLNFLLTPLVTALDLLAILCVLAIPWLAHELGQPQTSEAPGQAAADRFLTHAAGLSLVCALALVLHFVNALAVPLVVDKDSPSYLQGVAHWLVSGNLDGVSSYRGPGTTFLFIPFMAVFGRNPWGLKLLFHLLSIACVPLAYWLGWQLSRRRSLAFLAAFLTCLQPDLYGYSSLVVSEVPHVFAALLYCALLVSALKSLSARWILAAALAGSLTVLLRAEDFAALALGLLSVTGALIWSRSRHASPTSEQGRVQAGSPHAPRALLLAVLVAALPLLTWSLHNLRVYNFFGLSDYGGAALYDGWVYYGESSGISFADRDSAAVRAIQAVYHTPVADNTSQPTSWTVMAALVKAGYSTEQAFSLVGRAALDSIARFPSKAARILSLKIQASFEAFPILPPTFALPGEKATIPAANVPYFDAETALVPALVPLQRSVYAVVGPLYSPVYGLWFWCCLVLLWLGLYRRPAALWIPLVALIANYAFLPTIIGLSAWRYVLVGRVLMQVAALPALFSLTAFVSHYANTVALRFRGIRPHRPAGSQ